MSGVDRNVMRIAVYEMLYCPDIPINVTINWEEIWCKRIRCLYKWDIGQYSSISGKRGNKKYPEG